MKHIIYRRRCSNSPYKLMRDTMRHQRDDFDFDLSQEHTGLSNYYAAKVELKDLDKSYRIELRLIDISPEEIKIFITDRFIRLEAKVDDASFIKHFNFLEVVNPSSIRGRREGNDLIIDIVKQNLKS